MSKLELVNVNDIVNKNCIKCNSMYSSLVAVLVRCSWLLGVMFSCDTSAYAEFWMNGWMLCCVLLVVGVCGLLADRTFILLFCHILESDTCTVKESMQVICLKMVVYTKKMS
jgi:hypothetical protein